MTAELSAAMICIWFAVDHIFDHLRLWTTWKQCDEEHPKASFLDGGAPKSPQNQGKNRYIFLWEQDVAGSNPVIPTTTVELELFCSSSTFNYMEPTEIIMVQKAMDTYRKIYSFAIIDAA